MAAALFLGGLALVVLAPVALPAIISLAMDRDDRKRRDAR